jgi:hypothetical protein
MTDYREANYDEEVAYSFEAGVDDPHMSVKDEFSGEWMHYSYWANEDAGTWCYVEHDDSGNWLAPVSRWDCAAVGLRLDFPIQDKWTVKKLRAIAKERGHKRISKLKKAELVKLLRNEEIEQARTIPERIGRASAEEALDQIALFSSLEEALDNYLVNASDTLGEQGFLTERDASDMAHGFEAVLIERRIADRPHGL